jgi:hypothetical protein
VCPRTTPSKLIPLSARSGMGTTKIALHLPSPPLTLRRRHLPPLLALSANPNPQSTSSLLPPPPSTPQSHPLLQLTSLQSTTPQYPYKDLIPFPSTASFLKQATSSIQWRCGPIGRVAMCGFGAPGRGRLAGRGEVCEEVMVGA